jgi:subfamily B ATP-binding cassette protein MsbA
MNSTRSESKAKNSSATSEAAMREKSVRYRLWHVMMYFSKPHAVWVVMALAVVTGSALEPTIPALLKPLLDKGFQSKELPIWMIPVAVILLFTLRSTASFISDISLAKIAQTSLHMLRKKMFDCISVAELDLYRRQPATALANTVVFEATNGAVLLLQSVSTVVKDSLSLAALVFYLLYLNWKLTLIVLLIFPIVAISMRALAKRVYGLTKASQAAIDQLAYVVEESVLAHKEIRIQNAEQQQEQRFANFNSLLKRLAMKSAIAGSAVAPITNLFGSIALSAVISVAIVESQSSSLSAGGFVAFITAMLMLIAPIKHLSEVSSTITRGLVAAERAIALVETVPAEKGGTHTIERCHGLIEFKGVGVTYPDAPTEALMDINLTVEPGKFIALVGLSGSGKTTLANLLPRFVDCTVGHVYLDGVELRDWNLHSLRQQFALVGQHVVMFNDTVLNNVVMGQPSDRGRAMKALEAANMSDRIAALPQGLDTVLGHNASLLSGGERQRLAIARAIYKNAPILILDEATSALDTDTDSLVQASLRTAMKGRTTIAIAHRLTTIRDADTIFVLQHGRILQSGNHQALLAQGGAYEDFIRLSQA